MSQANKELVYQQGITYGFGETKTYTLSKAEPVSAIIIRCTMGALSGGSSGSYIANTALEAIKIRLNGKLIMDFDGLKNIAGIISMGVATLREFYKQMYVVAMPDNHYIIEFPTPLPKNSEVQIIFETAGAIASIQTAGGDRTTLAASTIDVLYRTGKLGAGKPIVPFISYTLFSHSNRTGYLDEFVPASNKPLRKLMMITYDGTTIADTTYDSLIIQEGSNVLVEGAMAYLRAVQGKKARVAQSTGHLHVGFLGKKVLSGTLKIQFYAGTAGTAKFVHLAWLAY
jgi:hypothetical protein